ncbi:MAG: transposase [Cytophagaceae bacterium]|nr:MAG: transposase [Cytophagaceae bacterium]
MDEAGFQCKLKRVRSRAICGQRATTYASAAPSTNFTISGAVSLNGPVVMRGDRKSMTTLRFLRFLRSALLPRLSPGDILVMGNLSAHRNKAVRRLCRQWDVRVVYLPPYSPEYNPIEKVWAWM